jgi:hypothetical protein
MREAAVHFLRVCALSFLLTAVLAALALHYFGVLIP